MTALKGKLNAIYSNRAEKTILRLQKKNYTEGNKVGSLLARQLRIKQDKEYIKLIVDDVGVSHNTEEGRASAFESFYRKLYTSEDPQAHDQHSYLDSETLPKIATSIKDDLASTFTIEEVQKAIAALKLNKTPGPDGFSAHFYRTFAPELAPFLAFLFNEIASTRQVTPSMTEALIVVIPKQGKAPTSCSSYLPNCLSQFRCQAIH